jgi:hypothetical protein
MDGQFGWGMVLDDEGKVMVELRSRRLREVLSSRSRLIMQ